MHAKKTIAIVCLEGAECEELRQPLEYFGYLVVVYKTGRPQHFMDILADEMPIAFDYVIIAGHGDEGKFCMTELGEDIYTPDEPRGDFCHKEVRKHLTWSNICVISTACTTGHDEMARVFTEKGNTYIAPRHEIYGDSMLAFVLMFFYFHTFSPASVHSLDIEAAHIKAAAIDTEMAMIGLWKTKSSHTL